MSGNRHDGPEAVNRGRILAHPQDLHCVIFHIACLVAYACAFWLYRHPELAGITGPWSRASFVAASACALGWISGINVGVNYHNHSHRRIFVSTFLNRWFGRLWTFSSGWPSFFWEYAHVTVHHANLLGNADWTLPKRNADGSFEDFRRYVLAHWPWRYAVHFSKEFGSRRKLRKKALREFAIFLAFWSIPFWIDPIMAVWLWVLPHWLANTWVTGSGMYVQHVGCVRKSADKPVSHSNIFLSKFFNLTMFNIGYHLEHHDYPRVHWSELPELHNRLKKELIDGGAHVLPYGYYHGSFLLAGDAQRRIRFAEQHLGYKGTPAGPGTRFRVRKLSEQCDADYQHLKIRDDGTMEATKAEEPQ
jgi:fatty acid desaturase